MPGARGPWSFRARKAVSRAVSKSYWAHLQAWTRCHRGLRSGRLGRLPALTFRRLVLVGSARHSTAVARLRAGREQVELEPLLSAQVLDRQLLRTAVPCEALRHAAALLTVMKSSTLTAIRERTFQGCMTLASITFPEGLASIGEEAFYGFTTKFAKNYRNAGEMMKKK